MMESDHVLVLVLLLCTGTSPVRILQATFKAHDENQLSKLLLIMSDQNTPLMCCPLVAEPSSVSSVRYSLTIKNAC